MFLRAAMSESTRHEYFTKNW